MKVTNHRLLRFLGYTPIDINFAAQVDMSWRMWRSVLWRRLLRGWR